MAAHVIVEELLDISQIVDHHGEGADILGIGLHVGHQPLAVVHLAAVARRELADERIGDDLRRALVVMRRVVDALHATPRGDVVFGRGKLQIGVVAQRHQRLHQPLAVRALPHQNGAVGILQRAAHDLRSRSGVAVHEHHDRHVGQHGIRFGGIGVRRTLGAPLHRQHLGALGQEHREYLDRLGHAAAPVVAIVENKSFQLAAGAQTLHRGAHLVVTSVGEVVVAYVADAVGHEARIRHARDRDAGARKLHLLYLARHQTLDGQFHLGARVALELRRDLGRGALRHVLVVDAHEPIADLQTRQIGGRAFVGLRHHHAAAVAPHADRGAHAAVFARRHHLELVHTLLRHVARVGVEVAHHARRAVRHEFVGGHLVDILRREFAHHVDHYLHVASQPEVVLHGPHARRHDRPRRKEGTAAREKSYDRSIHLLLLSIYHSNR